MTGVNLTLLNDDNRLHYPFDKKSTGICFLHRPIYASCFFFLQLRNHCETTINNRCHSIVLETKTTTSTITKKNWKGRKILRRIGWEEKIWSIWSLRRVYTTSTKIIVVDREYYQGWQGKKRRKKTIRSNRIGQMKFSICKCANNSPKDLFFSFFFIFIFIFFFDCLKMKMKFQTWH